MTEPQIQDVPSSSEDVIKNIDGQNKGRKRSAAVDDPEDEAKRRKEEKGVITEEEFSTIAENLNPNEYTNLAFKLGFTLAEVQDLKAENKDSDISKTVSMLVKWRRNSEVLGSRMKLASHLKAIGKSDLAKCVIDRTKPSASGHFPDFEFEEMVLYVEEHFPKHLLNKTKRLLNIPPSYRNTVENPEMLMQYLRDQDLLLRTNVCVLQSLLIKLKCVKLFTKVEEYGKSNDYVMYLFKSSLLQDIDFTRAKFKLKCSPGQLSRDELNDLVANIKHRLHITIECVVKAVEEGCTCITLDIPNENINALKNAALYDCTILSELGIFKVNIDGENYPDLCYFEHNFSEVPQQQSVTDVVNIVSPRGAVIKTAIRKSLSLKYKELNYMEPNIGNSVHYTLTDNYIEIELIQNQTGKSVKPTDILERETRKVLIEGMAGSGKTTFCQKLVHDWATSSDVVFDNKIPFFIRVNEITSDNIDPTCQKEIVRQAIFPKLLPTIFNGNLIQDDVWHYIQSNSGEFVFLLDGLEEASDECLTALRSFFNGEYLSFSTIIATTASGNLETGVQFDSHLMLAGFSKAQIEEYVRAIFKKTPKEKESFLKEINNTYLVELMKCPLFAVLLCLMWQEASYRKRQDSLPLTYTDLLSHFCMFLIQRYERKEKGRKSADFDAFQDVPQQYINTMISIGKTALDSVTAKSSIFQLNQNDGLLAERIGLITKSNRVTPLKITPSYIAVHKIIMEFLAAFYLKNTSTSYPVVLLLSNHMKRVTMFLTGLLDAENKSCNLLKLFVENSVQNYNLTANCLEECKNKVDVLKQLGKIVSKHTYLEIGGTRKESTGVLNCLYSMSTLIKPSNIMIMKIEASELFIKTDESAVTFAKLFKGLPKLIALNFPRFMSSSQFSSIITELKRGRSKRRCVSLEKISLVSGAHNSNFSEMVVEMLMMFQQLNELQVKMSALVSTRFLAAVSRHTCTTGFLENVQVLDISQLIVKYDSDSDNIVNILSELPKIERMVVPHQVLKLFYPRYYRTFAYGKYVLHKMPALPNVKLSVFLQIDVGNSTNNPKSTTCVESHNPLSVSYLPDETFSVPGFCLVSPEKQPKSKDVNCDLIETTQGVILLTYWDKILSHQRALDRNEIMKLGPSAVRLPYFSSGNSPTVAEIVNTIMTYEVILNDSSCTSLGACPKDGSVNMKGIEVVDLTECSLIERAAEALLKFPNLEIININEKLNPLSLLQELAEKYMHQHYMMLKCLNFTCSPDSFGSLDILKSLSMNFNDVCVSSSSMILMQLESNSQCFNHVYITLEKDPAMLMNLVWVKRIQFEEGNCKFMRRFSTLLDKSVDCFENLNSIDFMKGAAVDEKTKCILEDIKEKIPRLKTMKRECALTPNHSTQYKLEEYLSSYQTDREMALEIKPDLDLFDVVFLSYSKLCLTSSDITQVDKGIDLPPFPKFLVALPQMKQLTIQPINDQMHFLNVWAHALHYEDGIRYYNLHTLDLQGTKFKTKKEVKTLSSIIEYTPNLSTIRNAEVVSRVEQYFKQFLVEKEIVLN